MQILELDDDAITSMQNTSFLLQSRQSNNRAQNKRDLFSPFTISVTKKSGGFFCLLSYLKMPKGPHYDMPIPSMSTQPTLSDRQLSPIEWPSFGAVSKKKSQGKLTSSLEDLQSKVRVDGAKEKPLWCLFFSP